MWAESNWEILNQPVNSIDTQQRCTRERKPLIRQYVTATIVLQFASPSHRYFLQRWRWNNKRRNIIFPLSKKDWNLKKGRRRNIEKHIIYDKRYHVATKVDRDHDSKKSYYNEVLYLYESRWPGTTDVYEPQRFRSSRGPRCFFRRTTRYERKNKFEQNHPCRKTTIFFHTIIHQREIVSGSY